MYSKNAADAIEDVNATCLANPRGNKYNSGMLSNGMANNMSVV